MTRHETKHRIGNNFLENRMVCRTVGRDPASTPTNLKEGTTIKTVTLGTRGDGLVGVKKEKEDK